MKSLLLFLLVCCLAGCSSVSTERVSNHFDGRRFFNREESPTFADRVRWLWEMKTVEWPEWVMDPAQPAPPARVDNGRIRVTFINHATILIQMDGLTMITDPIWSMRAGPFSWLGSKRIRAPGVKMEDLPRIDIILISHDHYDHLDLPTLKALADRDRPLLLTGLGASRHLDPRLYRAVREMDWWEGFRDQASGIHVTFVPALHQSGRLPFLESRTLWGGFVIEGKAGRVYFAGDTGYGSFLEDLKTRFFDFSLTIFPLGSYEKRWFMKNQHMNPDDAVRAHLLLNSAQSIGMHYATFREHPEQALDAHEKDLAVALREHCLPSERFRLLKFGEGMEVGGGGSVEAGLPNSQRMSLSTFLSMVSVNPAEQNGPWHPPG